MQNGVRLDNVEAACALIGASMLCSLLAQHSFTQQSEIPSEIICWTILPILSSLTQRPDFRFVRLSGFADHRPIPPKSLWVIAAGLTTSSVYKAENGLIELSPLLTPLLLIAQRWLRPETRASRPSSPAVSSPLIWGPTLCSLIAVWNSSKWGLWGSMLSIVAVIPQLLAYLAWMPKDDPASQRLPPLTSEKQRITADIRSKIVAMLIAVVGVQTIIFGFGETHILHALFVGVAKAFFWLFILQTRRHVPWCIVPAIQTFSIVATYDPSAYSSDNGAIFNVVASSLALAQIIHCIPRQAKARWGLWVFLLAFLTPYLLNMQAIRSSQTSTKRSFSNSLKHPVEILVDNAQVSFGNLVQRQSRTYTAAYDEYRRRYKLEPPDGFQDWFNFASAHQSPIIDDFDTIYRSVSPFWNMSGAEVLHIMKYAQTTPEIELWSCVHASSSAKTRCKHPRRNFDRHISSLFDRLTKDQSVKLPDIKFLVNHLDEPRVLIPPASPKTSKILQMNPFNLTDMSHQPVWNALTRACGNLPATKPAMEALTLPFVADISSSKDLCRHSNYQSLHGLLMNPTSFRLIEGLVPVLSTGTLSTMGDILYPSPAYLEDEFQYDEAGDVDWEKKKNNLYWAGSTTGAYSSGGQWRNYHRQRIVSLVQNLEHKRHVYLREINGVAKSVASTFLNGRLFDVAFTKVFQCTMKSCREQRAHLKLKPWADKYKAFRSRLAFDIDGNGISGRYYQLLASKSAPLKQTLIREWHDDRLVPWAHYVPVSQGMEELPELVNYLTTSETGQRKAKEIADFGREWHSKAFREVDFSIYIYRLLLELARLQDPKREAMLIDDA